MRNWLSIFGRSSSPIAVFEDPSLGELRRDDNGWVRTLALSDRAIVLRIGGRLEPDERLLESARAIASDLEPFSSLLRKYLEEEAERPHWRLFADEIRRLEIAEICYVWPEKPRSGMVFFDGRAADRAWHCDLDNGRPWGLACDD